MSDLPSVIEFSEDVSKAEAPPLLPAGVYEAQISTVEPKVSVHSGNKYASVMFRIMPDHFPPDYDASFYPDGKLLAYNRVLLEDTPQARFRLRNFLDAIQAKGGKSIDVGTWVGLSAMVEVSHGSYEGTDKEELGRVTSV